jgi:hypothetical protein
MQPVEASNQEWGIVLSMCAQECNAVLQVFYANFYFEVFL